MANTLDNLIEVFEEVISGPKNTGKYLELLLGQDFFTGVDIGPKFHEQNKEKVDGQFAIRLLHRLKKPEPDPEEMKFFIELSKLAKANNGVINRAHWKKKPWYAFLETLRIGKNLPGNFLPNASNHNNDIDVVSSAPIQVKEYGSAMEGRAYPEVIQPGTSIGHQDTSAGTLGAFAFEKEGDPVDFRRFILSAWHVLGNTNAANEDSIYSPGRVDRVPPQNREVVAYLTNFSIPPQNRLWVDGAIAEVESDIETKDSQMGTRDNSGSEVTVRAAQQVEFQHLFEKLKAYKSGRTTGFSHAKLDGVGVYKFKNCKVTFAYRGFTLVPLKRDSLKEISQSGDSGSLWYTFNEADNEPKGIGLHMDGEKSDAPRLERAFACHLQPVLDKYSLSLDPPKKTGNSETT